MGFFSIYRYKRQQLKEKKLIFLDNLKNSGFTIALGEAMYMGGQPDILEKAIGNITVKDRGVFFYSTKNYDYFFIPVGNIIKCEFQTGEQISKNEYFSRLFAMSGYQFAFKKKTRIKHIYLTLTYKEEDVETSALFETYDAYKLTSAVNKIMQENEDNRKEVKTFTYMKELTELKALGAITEDEYNQKKQEMLTRI